MYFLAHTNMTNQTVNKTSYVPDRVSVYQTPSGGQTDFAITDKPSF